MSQQGTKSCSQRSGEEREEEKVADGLRHCGDNRCLTFLGETRENSTQLKQDTDGVFKEFTQA